MCEEHADNTTTTSNKAGDASIQGARAVRCPRCAVQFRIDGDGPLDELIAAVQQHASGIHGHDVTRDHVLARLTPA